MKHIACFHLFNDYSGSPKVLEVVVKGLLDRGYKVDLITSRGGVLDGLKGEKNLRLRQYNYRFSRNVAVRLLRYIWAQMLIFFIAFGYIFKRNTTVYINTILPLGAAIGARLACKKVVYHYHENAKAKSTAYRILAKIMQCVANRIICVSEYQRRFLRRKKNVHIIPNALIGGFAEKLHPDSEKAFEQQRVLMLGSLKDYKGTKEFIEIAAAMKNYNFEIVINDTQERIDEYLKKNNISIPKNLNIYSRQDDVTPFYNRASLVLNLSNKNLVIETFGLTALEAMTAGLPVIVPTVGGIAEMVTDGVNGYRIDVQDIGKIKERIEAILSDRKIYSLLAGNALECSKKYSAHSMVDNIATIL